MSKILAILNLLKVYFKRLHLQNRILNRTHLIYKSIYYNDNFLSWKMSVTLVLVLIKYWCFGCSVFIFIYSCFGSSDLKQNSNKRIIAEILETSRFILYNFADSDDIFTWVWKIYHRPLLSYGIIVMTVYNNVKWSLD